MSRKEERQKIAMNHETEKKSYIYMIRCQDHSIYTGITKNLERRMEEHKSGGKEAAKYTKAHGFLRLEAVFEAASWSEAARLEYAIKRLNRQEKEELIKNPVSINELFMERLSGCHFWVGIVE